MNSHLFILYVIFALTALDIYIGFCHKLNRAFIKYDKCASCGSCYKKFVSTGGYHSRLVSIETLLLLMTVLMIIVARFTYDAIKQREPSRKTDTIICVLSTVQMSVAILAVGCFLQHEGWTLIKDIVRMLLHNELMRPNSLATLQASLRLSLLVFSIGIISLHVAITFLEHTYPKVDPQFPERENYICFPQENDDQGAAYMNVLRAVDVVCSLFLVGLCTISQVYPAISKLHWPISLLSATRFIIVIVETLHVSSVNGDTQLDIILSVSEGICKVSDGQHLVFRALVAIFALRCIKGYITVNMASLAYGNSIVIVLFSIENFDDDSESTGHDLELQEIGDSLLK